MLLLFSQIFEAVGKQLDPVNLRFTASKLRRVVVIAALQLGLSVPCYAQTITLAFSLEDYDMSHFFDEFKERSGVDLRFAQIETSDLKMEILTRADARSLPDAIIVPGDLLGLKVGSFSDVPEQWVSRQISARNRQHGMVSGKLKGIPLIAGNHLVLYYNKKLIKNPARNWEILKTQKSQLPVGKQLIAWSYNEMFWIIPFLGAYDAYPFKNGKVSLNGDGIVQAFEFYKDLAKSGYVQHQCHYQCAFDKFVAGNLAYTINGSWSLGGFNKALGDDLGILALPEIGARQMRPYSSVHALAFPNNSVSTEKREGLKKFAEYMQSETVQQRIWDELNGLPVHTRVMEKIKLSGNYNLRSLLAQLESSEPMPNEAEMAIVWEALLMGFSRFQGDAMTAQQASEYMQYIAEKSGQELH